MRLIIRRSLNHVDTFALTIGVSALCLCSPAYAAGSNMPWEQPLQQILDSIQGPVAKIIAVIVIIMTGLATPGEIAEARRLGVTEIIEKPQVLRHFSEALARIASRDRLQDAT